MTATVESGHPTRIDRRKARTRKALVNAAREILVERGTADVSIQEITDQADVGFGSFYNHFTSKAELFQAAVSEALEEYGALLDQAAAGLEDPAEMYAVGVRMTARLASTQPAVARILVRAGQAYLVADKGLAPRALRDIQQGMDAGRFTAINAFLALVATAGCVLGFLETRITDPHRLKDSDADDLAEMLLRMLGVPARSAKAVAHRPLPQLAS